MGCGQAHTKDHASTRGLMKVLSRRKSLLEYIKRHDRCEGVEPRGQGMLQAVDCLQALPTPVKT